MTVYLCGFMGCGKSTVGKLLAKNLGQRFTDMDAYIVQCERMSIPDIFSFRGEEYFRDRETAAIEQLGLQGGVIACGGGAMLREENAALAAHHGRTVFIDVPFETCYERIKNDSNRPLVVNNTRASLEELFNKRRVIYLKNTAVHIAGTGSPMEIAKRIAADI
ncbi:MAG: shikimate kinase [Oscillospiraceae bacterium]|nr:shikimate kinase [Oscillospiraceae bacterium]